MLPSVTFCNFREEKRIIWGVCPAAAAFWRSAILCVLNIFSLMQRSIVMVNICISFFFRRLRLSVRVQGADTVSFQAVAPHSDLALSRGLLSRLLCILAMVRSNLIWFKGGENILEKKIKSLLPLENVGLVLPQALATGCYPVFHEETRDQRDGKVALQVRPWIAPSK